MREEYLDAGGSRKDKKREKSGKFRYFTRLINILFPHFSFPRLPAESEGCTCACVSLPHNVFVFVFFLSSYFLRDHAYFMDIRLF